MKKMTFLIEDMCCQHEVSALKGELLPLVLDESRLSFDIVARKMVVDVNGLSTAVEDILAAVRRTGMKAVAVGAGAASDGAEGLGEATAIGAEPRTGNGVGALQGCACCGGSCTVKSARDSAWSRHHRSVLCAGSGLLWALGFAAAVHGRGSLLGALGEDGPVPLAAALPWLAGTIAGIWPVLPKAIHSLRRLRPDMNLLMLIAVTGALALGDFSEGAGVAFLFALANMVESASVGRARRSIQALMDITPPTALVIAPLMREPVPTRVEEVPVGSLVLARPGDRIALDGVVVRGRSAVDQSPMTGESIPVAKGPGDEVFAGAVNGDGALEIRTTRPSSDTTLARIMHMVEQAQSRRAKTVQWVDTFAAWYTPAMVGLSALVALVPPLFFGGGLAEWFYQGLVVLVISCPCALVISTPVTVLAALASAARNGVLIKGGAFLEVPARLTAVALDKTGTLTLGHPQVTATTPSPGVGEEELLAVAATLESRSGHPLARAVVDHARSLSIALPDVTEVQAHPGLGVQGRIDGRDHYVGNARLFEETSPGLSSPDLAGLLEGAALAGCATVIVWNRARVLGTLCVTDRVRPEAAGAVAELEKLGVARVVMLTGDNETAAQAIARQAGVHEFRANLLPGDKTDFVSRLTAGGCRTAMVGDGVNDAPALAASHLGVAMGAIGSDAAIETADVALMGDDLGKLPWLIRHSRRALATIKANIAFALGLKIVFLGLVVFQMATLWMAIAADMGGSLIVIFNGLRLLRARK